MSESMELDKTTAVHLTAHGEMCNRLARGTRVILGKRKGDWIKITWRKGKKKGWNSDVPPGIEKKDEDWKPSGLTDEKEFQKENEKGEMLQEKEQEKARERERHRQRERKGKSKSD